MFCASCPIIIDRNTKLGLVSSGASPVPPSPQGAKGLIPGSRCLINEATKKNRTDVKRSFLPAVAGIFLMLLTVQNVPAEPRIGVGELNSLMVQHLPQKNPQVSGKSLTVFEQRLTLFPGEPPVTFLIPGFKNYHCGQCHQPERLVAKAAQRMRGVFARLRREMPAIKKIPLRQYIIQPYTDALLQRGQMAHATFDTIRVFPATILIDAKVYDGATHRHETLHLTQPFLGRVNELEAYGFNIRSSAQFLILKYPYFADVVQAYFVPEMDRIMKDYFARTIREDLKVPREVQWFLNRFDETALKKLDQAVAGLIPLLQEVSRLNREHPLKAAYWSDRLGIDAFLLELSAVKLLPLPEVTVSDKTRAQAFSIFELQMSKDDNTRLGYVIDRKKESLMTLKYGKSPAASAQRLALYFHFLKQRFLDSEGNILLGVPDPVDFRNFVEKKIQEVEKMVAYPGMTAIERQAGQAFIEAMKKNSP